MSVTGSGSWISPTEDERSRAHYGAIADPFPDGFLETSWITDAMARAKEERESAARAVAIARAATDPETKQLWTAIARDHRRFASHLERYAVRFGQSRIPRHLNFSKVRRAEDAARAAVERLGWTVVVEQPDDREPPPGLPPANGPPRRQLSDVHAPCCGVPAPPISWRRTGVGQPLKYLPTTCVNAGTTRL